MSCVVTMGCGASSSANKRGRNEKDDLPKRADSGKNDGVAEKKSQTPAPASNSVVQNKSDDKMPEDQVF